MVHCSESLRLRVGALRLKTNLGLAWGYVLRFRVVAFVPEPCRVYFSQDLRFRAGALSLESLLLSVEIRFAI